MFPTNHLKQKAIYWARSGIDGYAPTFDEAVEISVRWIQKTEMYINMEGQEQGSSAVVVLNQDVVVGDYLYLGELSDLSSAELTSPLGVDGAYSVKAFHKIPDIRGKNFVRKIYL